MINQILVFIIIFCRTRILVIIFTISILLPSRIIVKAYNTTSYTTFEAAVHAQQRIL